MSDGANQLLALFPGGQDLADMSMNEKVDVLESRMLTLPQEDCPVRHIFGPGLYIREVRLKAGSVAVGHHQKHEHMNVMLAGRVLLLQEDGTFAELCAPLTYVGKPGRKVGYIIEDVIWQNIYASNETDIDKLEATFLDKSSAFENWQQALIERARLSADADRADYLKVIARLGLDEDSVRQQTERPDDQIDMPYAVHPYRIAGSAIEGLGYFLTYPAEAGAILAPARIGGKRTPAGRYVNHSAAPNAKMAIGEDENIYLVAIRPIKGCSGGLIGEEVTVDYRQAIATTLEIEKGAQPCLQ